MSQISKSTIQNEGKKTPAVIYCLSATRTKDGQSLLSQEERCRAFAGSKNYDVFHVFYDEGVSGNLTERPGMQQVLDFANSTRDLHPVILIDDISRLARGLQTHLHLRAAISAAGAKLESPSIEFDEA